MEEIEADLHSISTRVARSDREPERRKAPRKKDS
jgi:hypothetical protein